jgi:peptide subunit release factor 1 (eRF1)
LLHTTSQARFGRLQLESRAAYIKQVVEATQRQWPTHALSTNPIKIVIGGTANLKEQLVAALPAALKSCVVRVFDTASNGVEGLHQAVAATLADVCGKAQLRADVGELEKVTNEL